MTPAYQDHAIHVVGIELRTGNAQAFQTIPLHWQRFFQEKVTTAVEGKMSDDVYAVYTHFQNAGINNHGIYSLVIGLAVDPGAELPLPAGFSRAVVPASYRVVFPVEANRPENVGEAWKKIWEYSDFPKTYIADYERYRSSDGTIDISIGVSSPISAP
ncbi:GyrI-like domain-containing protein [Herbaspirillum rhizosphaerae]|uniref:GyrI-like domain-containing protein n=1 Tax=Herbaspirillum rhizosphaerae TaxID=346179 RepID=UPI00067E1EC1|nr:effector binding domain-containing protein [Herbaspirillum rhizosphaerae]